MNLRNPLPSLVAVAALLLAGLAAFGSAGASVEEFYVNGTAETPVGEEQVGGSHVPVPTGGDVVEQGVNNGDAGQFVQVGPNGTVAVTNPAAPEEPVRVGVTPVWELVDPLTPEGVTVEQRVSDGGALRPATERLFSGEQGTPAPAGAPAPASVRFGYYVGEAGGNPFTDARLVPVPSTGGGSAYAYVPATEANRDPSLVPRDGSYRGIWDERGFRLHPNDDGPRPEGPRTLQGPGLLTPRSAPAGTSPILGTPAAVIAGAAAVGVLLLAPWLLYHRIQGHRTLAQAVRKRIFDAIEAKPGIGVQEIAQAAGVTYGTAAYHLERLVKARMILVNGTGGRLRYYKVGGALTEAERRVLPLLQNGEAMRILETILQRPGIYRAPLASDLGMKPTTLNWHLKRLLTEGLVSEVREGRSAHLYPAEETLRARLAAIREKAGGTEEGRLAQRLLREPQLEDAFGLA